MARRLIHSSFGLALRGIRENFVRMPAIGAPSREHIRKIYTIAAAMAGIAGAVIAQTTQTVSLETLDFQRSADVLVMLVLGGAGRLYGGLVGAAIFLIARDQLSGIATAILVFLDRHSTRRGRDVPAQRHSGRPVGVARALEDAMTPDVLLLRTRSLWQRTASPKASASWWWRATSNSACRLARATR